MGKRGPVPVPDSAKILAGTFRKDRAQKTHQLGAMLDQAPAPPRGLDKDAKVYWRTYASELVEMRNLAKSDLPQLEVLCVYRAMHDRLKALAAADGYMTEGSKGQPVPHPMLQEARQWGVMADRLAERFGLTPGARNRIAPPQTTPTQKSPWDDL